MTADDPDRQRRYWNAIAGRWRLLGPPLRPSAPDLAVMQAAVAGQARRAGRPLRAALLGVTAEIAHLARRRARPAVGGVGRLGRGPAGPGAAGPGAGRRQLE
jgi:hypothetical protein